MTERIMIDGDMIVRLFFYLTAICLIVLGFYPIYVFLVMLTVFFNGCNFVKYLRYLSETKKIIPNFVYY